MKIIVFILTIINLVYIPIKICVRDVCVYREYDFIFSIPNKYQLDYEKLGLQIGDNIVVEPFINEMAEAYNWADMVICRSGASTVSELAAVGLPSILVPYPHHKDQQQLLNAKWLAESGGASIIEQKHFSAKAALQILLSLSEDRIQLAELGEKVRTLAIPNADELISQHCLEVANG